MIQFQMFDHQPERCEKYHQMLTDNLPGGICLIQLDDAVKPILKNTEILSDGLISIHGPMRQN